MSSVFEMFPALCLDRFLAEQLGGSGKGVEKLVVQVVAVCDHQDGGVIQRQNDLAGEKDHRKGLAAALGMPHHAAFLISLGWSSTVGKPYLAGDSFKAFNLVLYPAARMADFTARLTA